MAGVVLIHGRGATAESMGSLVDAIGRDDIAYLAPQARGYSWYPNSFLAPLAQNEPFLSSAIGAVHLCIEQLEADGVPRERVVVLGFSQGACLALETVARNARRYGGVVAFSGGLIGSDHIPEAGPPRDKSFEYIGSLEGTPVFLGCSDVDAHIPVERVHQSAQVFEVLGGAVTTRIYEGMGHTINEDELRFAQRIIDAAAGGKDVPDRS